MSGSPRIAARAAALVLLIGMSMAPSVSATGSIDGLDPQDLRPQQPRAQSDIPGSSAGCAKDRRAPSEQETAAGSQPGSVRSGGLERTYIQHLPEGYSAQKTWPVVLVFHGRGSTAAETQEFSGLDHLPAVVVYADGVPGSLEDPRQAWEGAPYSAEGVDDLAFVDDLLDQLEGDLCLDTSRVYATGKSNGAGFVGILACERSQRITGIAPVAGAFYATGHRECSPSRPVPVVEMHGTADATIPYDGDPARGLPSIPGWTAAWAERNGCRGAVTTSSLAADIEIDRHRGCHRGAEVTHVRVQGGGHTWPGADAYSGGGATTHSVEATDLLWNTLNHYRLPR